MNPTFLLNHPALKNIAPEKLKFLLEFSNQNSDRAPKDMMPIFLAAMSSAKKSGMEFSSDETQLIIEIMKSNMSPEEKNRVDQIMNLMNRYNKK